MCPRLLLQAPTNGAGSKAALPEDLFKEPTPPPPPPAPTPMYQPTLTADFLQHQQQQHGLGHQPGQQLYGVAPMPGIVPPQGMYLQQPLQQQQYFQAQAPQPPQQLFQQQPAFGVMQAGVSNGSVPQGSQPGQTSQGGGSAQSVQGRTLSGKPLPQSNAPDPFAGLGF